MSMTHSGHPSAFDELRARVDALEAQHAVVIGFTSFLLKALVSEQPKAFQPELRATLENMFEHTIAHLLASDNAHPDVMVRAVEALHEVMFGKGAAET